MDKLSFSILLGPQPDKFIEKLDNQTKERIKGKLLKLQEDPYPSEVERIEGHH
ncbi:MAG: hypothetical protein AABX33_04820 [Nanoarchaeota archaeon]